MATQEMRLRKMIRAFQAEPDPDRAHRQWEEIEKEVFGVDFTNLVMPVIARKPLPKGGPAKRSLPKTQ